MQNVYIYVQTTNKVKPTFSTSIKGARVNKGAAPRRSAEAH